MRGVAPPQRHTPVVGSRLAPSGVRACSRNKSALLRPTLCGKVSVLMKRERIDKLLVERGLVESRTRAQALVMAGAVLVDEQRVTKPSDLIALTSSIRIKGADDPAAR